MPRPGLALLAVALLGSLGCVVLPHAPDPDPRAVGATHVGRSGAPVRTVLGLCVDRKGRASEVQTLVSSGDEELDRILRRTIERWRLIPTGEERTCKTMEYRFRVEGGKAVPLGPSAFTELVPARCEALGVPPAQPPPQTESCSGFADLCEPEAWDVVETPPQPFVPLELACPGVGLHGTTSALVVVDCDGRVQDVEVLHAIGHGCDETLAATLRATQFEPARTPDGGPIAARWLVEHSVMQ